MKKSRVFIAVGAMVLAVTAVFAGKANKKYFSDTLSIGSSGVAKVIMPGSPTLLTTKSQIGGNHYYRLFVSLNDATGGHSFATQLFNGSVGVYVK
jgi:hypothetical protein